MDTKKTHIKWRLNDCAHNLDTILGFTVTILIGRASVII